MKKIYKLEGFKIPFPNGQILRWSGKNLL